MAEAPTQSDPAQQAFSRLEEFQNDPVGVGLAEVEKEARMTEMQEWSDKQGERKEKQPSMLK